MDGQHTPDANAKMETNETHLHHIKRVRRQRRERARRRRARAVDDERRARAVYHPRGRPGRGEGREPSDASR